MKSKKTNDAGRLKRLLYNDYFNIPDSAFEILKNDITSLLSSYFELRKDSVLLTVEPDGDGNFKLFLNAEATNVKELKILD